MENTETEKETQPGATPDPREAEISNLKQSLSKTLGAYREAITRLNTDLPAEMVSGDTLESVDESVSRARALVSKVRQSIEAERAANKVPAGSSLRSEADLSGLSAREKIQIGIGGK